MTEAPGRPLVLFGAFDRHNLGDMLFAHVAAAAHADRARVFAGLAARDLTAWGGHRVEAVARLAAQWEARYGDAPADVVHVGGELLTCDAYEAAIMLMSGAEARAAIARRDADPDRLAWAQGLLGIPHRAAYVLPGNLFRQPGRFVFDGVGGVALERRDAALRAEVLANLRAADEVGVRDKVTLEILARAGVRAHLAPDPAAAVAQLFGARVADHGRAGEPARVRRTFPRGYLAVQFSADFGDDATLSAIAGQLDRAHAETGLGMVFFRAGAAPWHDDSACYAAVAQRMACAHVHIFESLDIWDICALIAGSRGCCGSSLHGRIVAEACGVPAVSLVRPADGAGPSKVAAYGATWGWSAASLCAPDAFAGALLGTLRRAC